MVTHLYVCENGGPLTIGIEGTPPKWVTCSTSDKAYECTGCSGALLKGSAEPFPVVQTVQYRCAAGHQRAIMLAAGAEKPESAHCPDCDGMLLPSPAV